MDSFDTVFLSLNLIGASKSFLKTLDDIKRIAHYDAGVYIVGETGTGKELAARAIHYLSDRKDAPFIPVNCGALSDELLYNELFGHLRGSFSGAVSTAGGLIDEADGGTLFLDEVDSLSPKFQVTLLRFLQEREYKPIGSPELKKADVRVICASNRDLHDCVKSGTFRSDLLFRIDLLRIELPPLRMRAGDISLLANHFLTKFSERYRFTPRQFSSASQQWMEKYHWPGNVRELENFVLKHCLLKGEADQNVPISADAGIFPDANGQSAFNASFNEEKERAIQHFEYSYLENVLSKTKGNVSRAAQLAGKERSCFSKLMKKHKLNRGKYKRTNKIV